MAGEGGAEQLRGIGARLRSAREKRGFTVLQAAEKLHVDARVLESLESEEFASLGAPVYARGHLRRYAELVGESPAELQSLYEDTTHTERPDLTRIPRSAPASSSSRLGAPGVLLLVGVALAGIVWWAVTMKSGRSQPVQAGASAGTTMPAAAAGSALPAPLLPQPATVAEAGPAAAGAAPIDLPPGRGEAQLALKFSAPSWVEVYDAGGHRLLHGVEAADSARTLQGAAPLKVVLGNAPGVALQMNGQPVTLDGLVHRDKSAHVLIDGSGHVSAAAPAGAPGG